MKMLLILFLPLLAIACDSAESATKEYVEANTPNPQIVNAQDLIQGQWVSVDNSDYEVIFSGNTKTDFAEGQLVDEAPFSIENGNTITLDPDLTDTTKLYIVVLTDSVLHLAYAEKPGKLILRKKN